MPGDRTVGHIIGGGREEETRPGTKPGRVGVNLALSQLPVEVALNYH